MLQVLAVYKQILDPYLSRAGVIEVSVNRPGEVYTLDHAGWQRHTCQEIDTNWCNAFARQMRTLAQQKLDQENPILSAAFPRNWDQVTRDLLDHDAYRIEIIVSPTAAHTCFSVRVPSAKSLSSEDLGPETLRYMYAGLPDRNQELKRLVELFEVQETWKFLKQAVRCRQNIVISGETGSGKTTLTKALIGLIPLHERLISLEDTNEITFPQPNHVKLFYPSGLSSVSKATAGLLLKSCLRLNPSRIILAELRGAEAYSFLRAIGSGHDGSITTVHARSAQQVISTIAELVKTNPSSSSFSLAETERIVARNIDLILHMRDKRVVEMEFPALERLSTV